MSDEEGGFLGRWSRLKRESRAAPEQPEGAAPQEPQPAEPPASEPAEEEFDVSSLPPIESLGADADYTAFLKKGVPKALRLAALRKAWTTDPAITGYKTLADYDWDCNAPGYGQLLPTDNPRKMVEAMFRHLRPAEEPAPAEPAPPSESARIAAASQTPEPIAAEPRPEPDGPVPSAEREPDQAASGTEPRSETS